LIAFNVLDIGVWGEWGHWNQCECDAECDPRVQQTICTGQKVRSRVCLSTVTLLEDGTNAPTYEINCRGEGAKHQEKPCATSCGKISISPFRLQYNISMTLLASLLHHFRVGWLPIFHFISCRFKALKWIRWRHRFNI